MIPQDAFDFPTSILRPTATATAGPVPTVIPNPIEYQVLGESGRRTLWVMFAIMLASSGIFAIASWNVPIARRVYYVTTTLATLIATLSYFALASGQASSFNCITVRDHHKHVPDTFHEVCRQVQWARYIDWALTTPMILLNLCLLGGIDGAHTLMAIAANLIMVFSALFSAFGITGTAQKWGWYSISVISYIFVLWHVVLHGTRMVQSKGATVSKLWNSLALFTFLIWTAYLIVWGVAQGARRTTVNTEVMIYAVLDALAKPVLGLWLLISHRTLAQTNIDLDGYWSNGLASEGRIRVGDED